MTNPPAGRLGGYLAAGITIGTLAGTADAAVVILDMSPFQGPNANQPPNSYRKEILLPGNNVFIMNASGTNTGVSAEWTGPLNLSMNDTFLGSGLKNLSLGEEIGAGANWNSDFDSSTYFNSIFGKQPAWGANSFIGFQADSATTPLYGWLEVTWDPTTDTFEILSGAFEDSGASILAGAAATSVVPEPASALATIALLAAGLTIRRRKQAD